MSITNVILKRRFMRVLTDVGRIIRRDSIVMDMKLAFGCRKQNTGRGTEGLTQGVSSKMIGSAVGLSIDWQ